MDPGEARRPGCPQDELLEVYQKQVRSVIELAVPVWQPSITKQERNQIERVQKCASYIILGESYTHYTQALELLDIENLEVRRKKICEKFAQKKAVKNSKFMHWFKKKDDSTWSIEDKNAKTQKKYQYYPVQYRTERYRDSTLPYLTELLKNMK